MARIDATTLVMAGRAAGLVAVGITSADPFDGARVDLETRKSRGLHAGMAFTYRNPSRSTDPRRALPSARSMVVGAYDYHRSGPLVASPTGPHGRVAAYAREDHYAALRMALGAMADLLREHKYRAVVVADQNDVVDRAAAHRAGIGWWGKSSNILIPEVGSMVVLGSVLTDADLGASAEPVTDGCGACEKCLDGCPTGAIVAPGVVDARRCLAWLVQADGMFPVEHRAALGDRIYGCDDCQDVCPPNQIRVRRPAHHPQGDTWVPLLDMLAAGDQELMDRYGRWYVPRREPRYLRRNALVVLGNVGDALDARTRDVLAHLLTDPDSLVRAHAVWAARRLGLTDLIPDHDPDPDVRVELRREVELAPGA